MPEGKYNLWGIYALILEKEGTSGFKIYIGSGTAKNGGVRKRLQAYAGGWSLLFSIQNAIKDSYKIVHKGLLCWTPIPPPSRSTSSKSGSALSSSKMFSRQSFLPIARQAPTSCGRSLSLGSGARQALLEDVCQTVILQMQDRLVTRLTDPEMRELYQIE